MFVIFFSKAHNPRLREKHKHIPTVGQSTKFLSSTSQNCQNHQKHQKSEKLSQSTEPKKTKSRVVSSMKLWNRKRTVEEK